MADPKIRTHGGGDEKGSSVSDGVAASFASLKTGLDGLILQTVLTAGSTGSSSCEPSMIPGCAVQLTREAPASKEPLSLQTTSSNFRKYVARIRIGSVSSQPASRVGITRLSEINEAALCE